MTAKMTGVAVVTPTSLLDATREVVGLFCKDPAKRANAKMAFSVNGLNPITHHAANWMVASDDFKSALANIGTLDIEGYLSMLPEEERAQAQTNITTALSSFAIYDPNNLYQSAATVDTWDNSVINVLPLSTGKAKETRDLLQEIGLVTYNPD